MSNDSAARVSLFRCAELRFLLAGSIAAVSLTLGLLTIIATRTDALMIDLGEWQPVVPPDHPEAARLFAAAQQVPDTRRPFRLTLTLPPAVSGLSTMAAEKTFRGLTGTCYDFRVYRWSADPSSGVVNVIYVNDRLAWTGPVGQPGGAVAVEGIRPEVGSIRLRLAVTRDQHVADDAAPLVHFEYATLRHCRPGASQASTVEPLRGNP